LHEHLRQLRLNGKEQIVICSVVPWIGKLFKRYFQKSANQQLFILGENLSVPIKNRYLAQRQVGQDRLVNAFAGFHKYAGPLLVISFGTAITFDLVSRKGEFQGGLILPGLETALEALSTKAALLPKISLQPPRTLIGRTTKAGMLSGIVYGYSEMVDGLIKHLRKKWQKNFCVVATGGQAEFIINYCKSIDYVERYLTLSGLNMLMQKNKKNNDNKQKIKKKLSK
jgi:type III pantothenate kinase